MQIQQTLSQYIKENILFGDGRKLKPDALFHESGILDSIGLIELIAFCEGEFSLSIADHELVPENLGSLRRLSHFIEKKISDKAENEVMQMDRETI